MEAIETAFLQRQRYGNSGSTYTLVAQEGSVASWSLRGRGEAHRDKKLICESASDRRTQRLVEHSKKLGILSTCSLSLA